MVGWVLERKAGCKGRHCCVCERSCPSGDDGHAQRCRSVPSCGSGETGDARGALTFNLYGFRRPIMRHEILMGNF